MTAGTEDSTEYSATWWAAELSKAEKPMDEKWRTSADKVVDRYLDVRGGDANDDAQKKYNIFWSNVQIMKSALYATPPKPVVKRQHDDATDDVARTAALMLQRMLTFIRRRYESSNDFTA